MIEDIIRFDNVTVCYGKVPAVHHVTMQIPCGSLVSVLGPNGAGKSTLLRAVLGWHPITGSITIGDDHMEHHLPRLAYLPQRSQVDWDFPATVRSVVEQGRYGLLGPFRGFRREDHAAVDAALAELGMTSLQDRQIRELSGGQQQRAFLARAVAQGADIFLLDEPFTGLDPAASQELSRRLGEWRRQGRTVLAVVHDLDRARRSFTHAVLMKTHLIAAGTVAEVMTDAHLAETFGLEPEPAGGPA